MIANTGSLPLAPDPAGNLPTSFILRLAGILFSLTVSLAVFLLFPPDKAGIFFIALSISIIVSSGVRLGYDNILVKEYAKSPNFNEPKKNGLYLLSVKNASVLFAGLLLLALPIVTFPNQLLNTQTTYPLVLSLLLAYFSALNILTAEMVKGCHKVNLAILLQSVIPHIPPFILILTAPPYSPDLLLVAYMFGHFLAMAFGLLGARKALKFARPSPEYRKNINAQARNLYFTSFVLISFSHVDLLLLGYFFSAEEAARYALASKFGVVFSIVLSFFNSVYSPRFARAFFLGDLKALQKDLRSSSIMMAASGAFLFFLAVVTAPSIVSFLNTDYAGLHPIILLISFAGLVQLLTGQSSQALIMTENIPSYRRLTVSLSIVGIVLYLLFIPLFGIAAAAAIYLTIVALKNILGALLIKRLVGVSIYG